jgi:uncharacterized protein (TIGR02186 family)
MRKVAFAVILAGMLIVCAVDARAERLVLSVSTHQVAIRSNFTGVDLTLFGTIEPDAATVGRAGGGYNLVATVIGPRQTMVTWRKKRIAGVWVNADSRTMEDVPAYLAVLSNRPLAAIAGPDVLQRFSVGLQNSLARKPAVETPANIEFRDAFIRVKREQGLYRELNNAVTFLTPTLFRASVPLPANVPVGEYEIQLKLFSDGVMIAQEATAFEIVKVGFEQYIATAAREQGLLYGIATAMLALLTGWLGALIFRRD